MDEQVEALKNWLDEGKSPEDFKKVGGWDDEKFEELLTAVMNPTIPTKVMAPTPVVEDDDE